ncbi:stage V sporulation protein AA [Alkalihalobacillus sp. AL-G]|uniref:stage V sporulation protein AA n=1 Tax=Alkalihalobacillus sp. AL-G TaxID=2926399 RepID=UPI00272D54E1|nr:stage V sporulation protein AA [Alkalihalobacillus sp. AL-G]WLD91894.1 stage V sporulation protein AA [Alkalihalobacillus sp. AL-G]
MDVEILYLRMRHRLFVSPDQKVRIKDVAQLVGPDDITSTIGQLVIHKITVHDKTIVIIDLMKVLRRLREFKPDLEVQTVGPPQTIIEVQYPKSKITGIYFVIVWVLLFIGSGLAIMNFHEDVSMQMVHQKIYYIITGKQNDYPLLLQIPYSLGLGLGMVLFFNHIFKKRFNEEPSPLEVEMFNYQQDLDQYVIMNENKENEKKANDD